MNIINNIATGLEEIYLQRDKIPELWTRVTTFYAENVWKDLIDLGEKVHMVKQTHSPKSAIAATFFPRTVKNFKAFEEQMDKFMDSSEEETAVEEPEATKTAEKHTAKLLYTNTNGKPFDWSSVGDYEKDFEDAMNDVAD
jgi:hypothetical protein